MPFQDFPNDSAPKQLRERTVTWDDPLISAAAETNDEIRELTKPVVAALIDGGFFHMLKPRSVGGMELMSCHCR